MVLPIVAFWGACKVCAIVGGAIFCTHKVTKSYNKYQKNKRKKLELKEKTIDQAREDNEKIDKRNKEIDNQLDWKEQRIKQIEQDLKDTKEKRNKSGLTENQKKDLDQQIAFLTTQLDEERKRTQALLKEKGKNSKDKDDNNKIISGIGLGNDKHWIWDLITLENAIILGGCYLIWQLAKDDKDK